MQTMTVMQRTIASQSGDSFISSDSDSTREPISVALHHPMSSVPRRIAVSWNDEKLLYSPAVTGPKKSTVIRVGKRPNVAPSLLPFHVDLSAQNKYGFIASYLEKQYRCYIEQSCPAHSECGEMILLLMRLPSSSMIKYLHWIPRTRIRCPFRMDRVACLY